MDKKIFYIILVLILSFACEDVYHPDLDQMDNLIVIEALITNNADKNFVKVSKTKGFYDEGASAMVFDATVELIDGDGQVYHGTESSTGYFLLNYSAVPGKKYKLKVIAENETYESDVEEMPPLPTFDSLYVKSELVTDYYYSSYGEPISYTEKRMHAYVDLPATDSLSRYRFSISKTMQYVIPGPPRSFNTYGWINFGPSGSFNIKGPSKFGVEDTLKKHSLLYMSKNLGDFIAQELIDYAYAYMEGWLVNMDEYGLSESTYNYYESMNDQLDASGKLFDAIYAQLVPNIRCSSNPDKRVLGFFELSSHRFTRFFAYSTLASEYVYFHLVNNESRIPASDAVQAETPPDFWENRYDN